MTQHQFGSISSFGWQSSKAHLSHRKFRCRFIRCDIFIFRSPFGLAILAIPEQKMTHKRSDTRAAAAEFWEFVIRFVWFVQTRSTRCAGRVYAFSSACHICLVETRMYRTYILLFVSIAVLWFANIVHATAAVNQYEMRTTTLLCVAEWKKFDVIVNNTMTVTTHSRQMKRRRKRWTICQRLVRFTHCDTHLYTFALNLSMRSFPLKSKEIFRTDVKPSSSWMP